MQQPQQAQITPVQIQMAAAAGVRLLAIDDLPVPMELAKTGAIALLEGVLKGLASGELVVSNPSQQEEGDPEAPQPDLQAVEGGKEE